MSIDDLKVISIRKMCEADIPYIYSSWMEDYLSSHFVKQKKSDRPIQSYVALMPRELYYKEQRARIDKILKKSLVYVACNSEDEEQIFGYIVFRTVGQLDILSWLYVRPVYRGFGIANKLMQKMGEADVITHLTPMRRWILKRYNLIFNPFMEAIDD
jgi:ribosomal protein S18 acetylase RimI-like enzyme